MIISCNVYHAIIILTKMYHNFVFVYHVGTQGYTLYLVNNVKFQLCKFTMNDRDTGIQWC